MCKKKKKVLPYLAIVRHLLAKQANKLERFPRESYFYPFT